MSIAFNQTTNRHIFPSMSTAQGNPDEAESCGCPCAFCLKLLAEIVENAVESTSGTTAGNQFCYAVIRNIPPTYHSADLRHFFSAFVEYGRFRCFHFRHRPEIQEDAGTDKAEQLNDASTSKFRQEIGTNKRLCCVVQFYNRRDRSEFIRQFHTTHWTDSLGNEMALRCFVFPIRDNMETGSEKTGTNGETVTEADIKSMIELRPPIVMPQGNVGTPSDYFMEQIRQCKLPTTLIGKLGLKTKRRTGKFGSVPMDYGMNKKSRHDKVERDEADIEYRTTVRSDAAEESGKLSDDEEMEEWERHEAIYDDVHEQDRNKERKYEEEMEVVWEKGGPGLVWYTDQLHWKEAEQGTDCDEMWADDWDVDYSIYYERGAGDLDARAAVEMRHDSIVETGALQESVFRNRPENERSELRRRKRRASDGDAQPVGEASVGRFEKHNKGFAGRYMRDLGWKPGHGLGQKDRPGQPYPILVGADDQPHGSHSGLGYRGEKLQRTGFTTPKEQHSIKTKYDMSNADEDERSDKILRRHRLTHMKFRK